MKHATLTHIKQRIHLVMLAMACLALFSTLAQAHGDEIHVIGIVSSISDNSISVKTKEGKIVDVAFGDKTTYLRMKAPIERGAIRVGDRVVIHAVKVKEDLVAHTVELGAAQH